MIEITQEKLMLIGSITFGVTAFCQIANFIIFFSNTFYLNQVIQLANIVFSLALTGFFITMLKASKINLPQIDEKELAKDLNIS